MLDRIFRCPGIQAEEAAVALFFQRFLDVLFRAKQVIAEQGKKRHGNQPRRYQRNRHHDGQAVQELTCAAGDQQERDIRNNVGYGCVQDGCCQLGGSEPGGNDVRVTVCQGTLDGIAGDHGIIH